MDTLIILSYCGDRISVERFINKMEKSVYYLSTINLQSDGTSNYFCPTCAALIY